MSGGRIIFGVGRGYHTREVETFGSPLLDQPANRELFEEQVDIIFKAFNNESFTHKGKHYTLPPRSAVSRLYAEGTDAGAAAVAAAGGMLAADPGRHRAGAGVHGQARHPGLVGGGSAEGGAMHKVVLGWQEAHARIGKHIELGERLCFGFHFYIADSREEGIREAGKYYEENMKMFGELRLVRALTDEQIEIMRDPEARADGQTAADRGCDRRRRVAVRVARTDHRASEGAGKALSRPRPGVGQPQRRSTEIGRLEQLERFGKEVMPAFAKTRTPELVPAQ